jgi:hypothetical protein
LIQKYLQFNGSYLVERKEPLAFLKKQQFKISCQILYFMAMSSEIWSFKK